MPSWQPIWTDVRFDHAKAAHACDELRRCAALLDAQTERRVRLAAGAQDAWRGRARRVFDGELSRMRRQAADLVDALHAAARQIEHAAAEARLEQHRREASRATWWDEKRREDGLRAEQGLPPTPGPQRPRPVRAL